MVYIYQGLFYIYTYIYLNVDVPDIIIAVRTEENGQTFDLITHKYVGIEHTSEPVHLTTYDGHSRTFHNDSVNLFSNKMLNLEGKHIKVATLEYKPYTILRKTVYI